jgi:hypothetical protein
LKRPPSFLHSCAVCKYNPSYLNFSFVKNTLKKNQNQAFEIFIRPGPNVKRHSSTVMFLKLECLFQAGICGIVNVCTVRAYPSETPFYSWEGSTPYPLIIFR